MGSNSQIRKNGQIEDIPSLDATTDPAALEAFAHEHGIPREHRPVALVKPREASDVAAFVKSARRAKTALVALSSGPPHHGLWTDLPAHDWAVLDMRLMNRVLRADRRNRVAIIEPGVTFSQLDRALAPVGLRAMTPLSPRTQESVLAAYLDRVPTLVPRAQWDLSDPLLCTEVVMGTGDIFRTGEAAGPGTLEEQWSAGQAQKNPMGPSSFDFFRLVQGSRGSVAVVTWASIKCELRPREHELLLATSDRLAPLAAVVHRLSRARWGEECLILDRHCFARLTGTESSGQLDMPNFVLLLGVAGFDYRPEQRVAYQSAGIRRIAQEEGLELFSQVGGVTSRRLLEVINTPSEPYWKDADGTHLDLYFLTTMDRCFEYLQVLEDACATLSFDRECVGVYIQPQLGGRVAHFEAVAFHPDDEGARRKAETFIRSLAENCAARGAYFSRPYGIWGDLAWRDKPLLVETLRRVKRIFDPEGILNPETLCFSEVS